MERFRHLVQSVFGKGLLVLIILPFAFFGIEGILSQSFTSSSAIDINDHEISKAELDKTIESQRQRMLQGLGAAVDPSLVTAEMVRPTAIEGLIQRYLIIDAVRDEGMTVPDSAVKSYVRSFEQFHDEKGAFSQERLERVLAQNNYTTANFLKEIKNDMATQQLQNSVVQSSFSTPRDIAFIKTLESQRRDFATLIVTADSQRTGVTVSDNDIKDYYEAHKNDFRTEEKVKVNYLHFVASDFASTVESPVEEDIKSRYGKMVEELRTLEKRDASHILIEVGEKRSDEDAKALADKVLKRIEGGEPFDALAKEFSDDSASSKIGGALGVAGRGVYDPAFEEALYALATKGSVSPVVKSEFGYHIIKLNAIDAKEVPTLDSKREKIITDIREERAKEKLTLAVDEINRLAFESGDLSVIGDQYKKTPKVSEWLTRTGNTGVFADKAAEGLVFSPAVIEEKRNSDAVELADGSVIVVHLQDYEPSSVRELAEVEADVRSQVTLSIARSKAKTLADDVRSKVAAGQASEEIAKSTGLSWKKYLAVERGASAPERIIVQKGFTLPKPAKEKPSVGVASIDDNRFAVIHVLAVNEVEIKKSDEEMKQVGQALAIRNGTAEFQMYTDHIKSKASIDIRK